jgi:hypothetical protein
MEQVATNQQIADRLTAGGFANVAVIGHGRQRTAEATWPGPDTTAELDPHLSDVTELTA